VDRWCRSKTRFHRRLLTFCTTGWKKARGTAGRREMGRGECVRPQAGERVKNRATGGLLARPRCATGNGRAPEAGGREAEVSGKSARGVGSS
jgi:hypothetical protein